MARGDQPGRHSNSASPISRPEAATRSSALRDKLAKIDNWNLEQIESALKTLAQKLGCKTGDLVHPARVAVSGRTIGPSLYHMLEVMGKERVSRASTE
jgi:glutamyl-tRNA synthetase